MQLSKENIPHINAEMVIMPSAGMFALPEKVLQFGTGVLLRGLPDYFIDKANRKGLFNGRIVVVKSTDAGDATAFAEQDGLYTLCIRGIEGGKRVAENSVCAAISRVLSAKEQWKDVLACAANADLNIIISNTTEVGIQLVAESVFQQPPLSFPAKLLSFLYERFKKLGDSNAAEMVVLPTELITDNGKKLQAVCLELAYYNKLEETFVNWFNTRIHFCNTLVDCIVPGKPAPPVLEEIEKGLGYTDALLTISEVYRLWAIEGGAAIKQLLSFAAGESRIVITPDITKFKELKLRLLNGTHTLSCGLAFLCGISTVKEGLENEMVAAFISGLMLNELAPAVPYALEEKEAINFGRQVLERFRNPAIQHQWLSICAQYSSKMAMRAVPVLLRYIALYRRVPEHFALGFAAYLLFMKAVKKDGHQFWGECNNHLYAINDDQAGYYFELWQQGAPEKVVHTALRNVNAWGTDLSHIGGFDAAVTEKLQRLVRNGAMQTLTALMQTPKQ